jgi:hypothetical protein
LFDMVDGRVARATSQVTRFGGFFDSVIDRYSDLALYMGLLVYYASINRFFYIVLTAVVMTGSVMISYTRARAENAIPKCKVGFLERPERVVLIIIGALFDRMAAVLWVIAVLSNLTVVHRMIYTWQEANRLEDAQLRSVPRSESPPLPRVHRRRVAKRGLARHERLHAAKRNWSRASYLESMTCSDHFRVGQTIAAFAKLRLYMAPSTSRPSHDRRSCRGRSCAGSGQKRSLFDRLRQGPGLPTRYMLEFR